VLTIHRFIRGPLPNNVFILANEAEGRCAVVDPGIGCEDLLEKIAAHGWKLELILLTHAHFDHCYGNAAFVAASGAPIAMHPDDKPVLARLQQTCINWGFDPPPPSPEPSIWLEHGMSLDVLGQAVEVRHTPGHCPGQVAFIWPGHCVSGDTLFHRGIGRWDLPGASYEDLERSIREQLFTLPDETVVYPGHMELTTIGEEKRLNPYVGEAARFTPKL
jgi:glyoxylase-like metal-dependent hydrolase (beta-lactamase superfamily II)